MQTRRIINPKNTKKSPIHENMNAKITSDFGDDRCRIAAARLEKDIFVRTDFRDSPPIVVKILGGCPFHGRVERDEIPTRESPPKQSGTLPCPALPCPPLHSTPLPSPPPHSLPSACLLLCLSMHTVCEVGELN